MDREEKRPRDGVQSQLQSSLAREWEENQETRTVWNWALRRSPGHWDIDPMGSSQGLDNTKGY